MSILNVQQNILTAMQDTAQAQLDLLDMEARLVAMWQAESMNALTDADIQALPEFAHVTAQELTAAKNAMDAFVTAGGGFAVGTNAIKLLRIVRKV